tara:strand:- start:167 stop:829 length:663 start_codon:yes stop_codon:yes gene_type:complete
MAKATQSKTAGKTTAAKKTTSSTTKKASSTTKKAAPKKTSKTTTTKTKPAQPTERKERVRRVVNKESILGDFDALLSNVEQQIELIKSSDVKGAVGVKYFKTLNKQLRQLRGDVGKNIKVKRQVNSDMSKTSGFLKPVNVSKEVSKFAGWKEGEQHSRVDVTKFICNYVKSNDLQNPKDRRQILPDKKLRTLLKLSDSPKEPLTYYSLQRHIQPHFVKST